MLEIVLKISIKMRYNKNTSSHQMCVKVINCR